MDSFLVTKVNSGLGDNISTLLGAWVFAKTTGRTLVIDWRYSRYVTEASVNVFGLHFQPSDQLAGVPLICDISLENLALPEPYFPEHWKRSNFNRPPTDRHVAVLKTGDPKEWYDGDGKLCSREVAMEKLSSYERMMVQAETRSDPTIIFDHGFIPMRQRITQKHRAQFFFALQLLPPIQWKIDKFAEKYLLKRPIIGLHFRHGNGEFLYGRNNRWIGGVDRILANCRRAIRAATAHLGAKPGIFVCTDSHTLEQALLDEFPLAFSRPKRFAQEGDGPLHRPHFGILEANNALIEMWLLAKCDALIHTQSRFTFYARNSRSPFQYRELLIDDNRFKCFSQSPIVTLGKSVGE